jgi:GNAT superfamily N-acetyltransferase
MIRNAWKNAMAELPKNALPRDKYANYITAVLDTAMAATPFMPARGGGKRMPAVKPGTTVKDVPLPVDVLKVSTVPLPKKVSSEPARAPVAQEKPVEVREPWYEKKAREDASKIAAEEDIFGPPPSGPLPEVSMGPKAEAMKLVEDATSMRMNEIADLIETGIGGLSGKGKAVEGLENMTYEGQQGVSGGFGKIRVKGNAAMPELTGLKESPAKIAEAIRKDGNNPLYLRIKDAVSSDIKTRFADDIAAIESGQGRQTERTPEGFFDYFKTGVREPGQEGFADIDAKPLGDFMDSWILKHPKGGNMEVRFGENGPYIEQVRVPPEMRGKGHASDLYTHLGEMMKARGLSGDSIQGNIQGDPAQIARLRSKAAAIAGQGKSTGDRFEVFGDEDPNDFMRRMLREEGFADISRRKGWAEQKYPSSYQFKVDWPEMSMVDEVKGLNPGHARYRAKENWPDAEVDYFIGPLNKGELGFADLTPDQRSKIVALSRGYERNPVLDTSLVGGAPTGEMPRYRRSMTNPDIDASFI